MPKPLPPIALTTFACAMGILVGAPAAARDLPAPQAIGDWTVAPSADGEGCFVTRTYDRAGGTTLLLGLDADGANRLSILNENWSIKPGQRLQLTFRLSHGGYVDQAAVGLSADGKRGFVTDFEAKFPGYFASSAALAVFRGDVPVERLSLDGSGAAVAGLRTCVGLLRAKPATGARRDARPDRIPRDPFAGSGKRESRR